MNSTEASVHSHHLQTGTPTICCAEFPPSTENLKSSMLHQSSNNGREARNRAEKNRRDTIGGFVQHLSTIIPHVRESPRRVDKTAILRLAAHGLRMNYVFGKTTEPTLKNLSEELTDSLLRMLDTFFITVNIRGQITFVSSEVETHLGHCQTDLYGRSILGIVHPDDQAFLKRQLIPNNLDRLFDIQPHGEHGEPRIRTADEEQVIDQKLREDKRKFSFRIARAGPRSEPTTYEMVRLDGCFRRADLAPRGLKEGSFSSGLQMIRRNRGKHDSIPLNSISGNDIVLIAMVHVIKPPSMCDRLFEATKFEYMTRHLIDGQIVQCDQRISVVAGYMADEVCGLSPFSFMHKSDVRWVMVALRQMYDCSNNFGESCYRLIARNGEFIYLRTHGYLDINNENKVGSFVCRNTLVSEEEGMALIQKMKNRFVITIQDERNALMFESDMPVEGPAQLERAIMRLIMKLPHSAGPTSYGPSGRSVESCAVDDTDMYGGKLKSPLAYITPTVDTIRVSIDRSVRIIEISTRRRSESDEDAPSVSPACSSHASNNESTRTSELKEQLVIFQRKIESEITSSGDIVKQAGSQPFVTSPNPPDHRMLVSADNIALKEEPALQDARAKPTPISHSENTNKTLLDKFRTTPRYVSMNKSTGNSNLKLRQPNPIENKPRDFCSSVGGFNFDGHVILQKDSQTMPHKNNQNTARDPSSQLKRKHSSLKDVINMGGSDEAWGTMRHSNPPEPYSTNRKVFVTHTNTMPEYNTPAMSQYDGFDEQMSDSGTSVASQLTSPSSYGCVDSSIEPAEQNPLSPGDLFDSEEFQLGAEAFIKTEQE